MFENRKIFSIEKTDSTNKYLAALVKSNDIENGSIIMAYEQYAGRGQAENVWESQKGKNLTMSMIYYPVKFLAERQFYISKVVALSCFAFIRNEIGEKFPVKIKWSNDIFIGDKKVGGILIENSLRNYHIQSCIIGIGLNINQSTFSDKVPNAVSLFHVLGVEQNLNDSLAHLLKYIDLYFEMLQQNNFQQIDNEYITHLYRFGEYVEYKDKNGQFMGRIVGVEKNGILYIETIHHELRNYLFKEVEFII